MKEGLRLDVEIEGAGSNAGAVLAELAERARQSYSDSVKAWVATAYVLAEAREIATHGQWTPFLAEAGIPPRTARRMLQLARAGIKTVTVTDLGGIKSTLGLLSSDPAIVREAETIRAEIADLRGETGAGDGRPESGRGRARSAEDAGARGRERMRRA